jgi:hypothetical protein
LDPLLLSNASPKRIFPLISDLRRFANWSPWEDPDTDAKGSHSGPTSGKGATYEWVGNSDTTSGRVEITSVRSPTNIRMQLDFERKFEMQNIEVQSVPPLDISCSAEFEIVERGGATVVTWRLRGKHSMVDKLKSFAAMLNNALGYELDVGLARLKKLAEG